MFTIVHLSCLIDSQSCTTLDDAVLLGRSETDLQEATRLCARLQEKDSAWVVDYTTIHGTEEEALEAMRDFFIRNREDLRQQLNCYVMETPEWLQ